MNDYAHKPTPKANAAVQHERPESSLQTGEGTSSDTTAQLKAYGHMANNSAQTTQLAKLGEMGNRPLQKKPNRTGLPDNLKSGMENLSGHSLDDVKVHYNSARPAQLQAHAYAQGSHIHLAPGQEKHLPHEAWHVVQQKQGRVQPTTQLKGQNINDNAGLEKEADRMGSVAQLHAHANTAGKVTREAVPFEKTIQRKPIPAGAAKPQTAAAAGSGPGAAAAPAKAHNLHSAAAAASASEAHAKEQAQGSGSGAGGGPVPHVHAAPAKPHDAQSAAGSGAEAKGAGKTAASTGTSATTGAQQLYTDHRGGGFQLCPLGNNDYMVMGDGIPYTVTYVAATDQYLIGEDKLYWDPLTANTYMHTGDSSYEAMDGTAYEYEDGMYMFKPIPSAELKNFLTQIWAIKEGVLKMQAREALYHIYKHIYSKKKSNRKTVPQDPTPALAGMIDFFGPKGGFLQNKVVTAKGDAGEKNVSTLFAKLKASQDATVRQIIVDAFASNYYHLALHPGVKPQARIMLNVAPNNIPAALKTLYPILTASPVTYSMKAGSPAVSAGKLDSIVIYVTQTPATDVLINNIIRAGIAVENLIPGLMAELAPGIAYAHEPAAVGGTNISFGQKRAILAYMALKMMPSFFDGFVDLACTYMAQAGVNTQIAWQELAVSHDPSVVQELAQYLTIMNAESK